MDAIIWSQLPDTAVINILAHLSLRDRAQASAICKRWRDCYYHPSFWRRVSTRLSATTGCEPARCVLDKCGKFVHELTVMVSLPGHRLSQILSGSKSVCPSSTGSDKSSWLVEPYDLSKYKTFYRELPNVFDGLCRGQGLEKLILGFFPECENCKCPLSPDEEFEVKMTESLRKVIQASTKLKNLALGHSISCSLQSKFLKELSEKFSQQLQVLHIPAFLGTDDLVSEAKAMTSSLQAFTSLSVLTLNTALVTNQLLQSLSGGDKVSTLQQLNMVTGYRDDIFVWADDSCWSKLALHCPDLLVTLSVVISDAGTSDELVQYMHRTPSMPLTSLRIFVRHPNSLKVELMEQVAKSYCGSLSCLELHAEKDNLLFGNDVDLEADPFVMLCWKCKKLRHIVITGYKLLACNILAIALLRGPGLITFEVERDLIYYYDDMPTTEEEDDDDDDDDDDDYETPTSCDSPTSETGYRFGLRLDDKIHEISKSLKRPWAPIKRRHMTLSKFLTHDLLIDADG